LGLAHIGVIKVLEELGIPIDMVVGTSMGAIVGGFYAQGFDAARLEKVALSVDWADILMERVNSSEERFRSRIDRSRYFASIDFDRRGFKLPGSLLSGRKLLYFLDRSTFAVPYPIDFDSLPRRYRGVAADLATGDRVVIDHGSLADVMRASMGIPGVLAPHLIGNQYLVDGGMVDNLPISTARELGADLRFKYEVQR
jgi:NTE family protein